MRPFFSFKYQKFRDIVNRTVKHHLVNGEADLISAALVICCGRTDAVDFIWTLSEGTSGFVIKSTI